MSDTKVEPSNFGVRVQLSGPVRADYRYKPIQASGLGYM